MIVQQAETLEGQSQVRRDAFRMGVDIAPHSLKCLFVLLDQLRPGHCFIEFIPVSIHVSFQDAGIAEAMPASMTYLRSSGIVTQYKGFRMSNLNINIKYQADFNGILSPGIPADVSRQDFHVAPHADDET